jgi:outer membrane receptor protein involved in Fe transport
MYGQPSVSGYYIKGHIIEDETNENLEYVNVVAYSQRDSSIVTGTITNKQGYFTLQLNKPGAYYVTADFIGYEKIVIENITLTPEKMGHLTGRLKLKPSTFGIDAVEVVAEKPFVTYQLDKKVVDVSLNPSAQGGTAVDALENVPSIQTDMEGNVTLRGSSSFTVLIDGRQTPLSGTDALNQIPASAIEKIEIITNPSVKYDPDGTTGIINIISKKNRLKGHSVVLNTSAGTSPMYSGDVNYTYRRERINFTGGVNYRDSQRSFYNTSDRYTNIINENTGEVDSIRNLYKQTDGLRAFKVFSIKGGLDYELFDNNIFNVMLSLNDFTYQRTNDSRISDYNNTPFQTNKYTADGFKTNPQNWQINIGDKQVFNNDLNHYLRFDAMYQTGTGIENNYVQSRLADIDWEVVGQDTVDQQTQTEGNETRYRLEIDYMRPLGENTIFETGYTLRIDEETQDFRYFTRDGDVLNWVRIPELDDQSYYRRNINAVWALFKTKLYGLNLTGGLRVEHTDRHVETEKDNYEFNYNYLGFYPSFALSKEFKNKDVIQGSYSRRINRPRPWYLSPFPRLSDGYSQYRPNPELEPEYTSSFEINFQKSLKGISFLSLETFYHHTTNKIERLDLIENDTLLVYTRTNLDDDRRLGAELGGHIKLARWFSFQPGFSAYYYETEGEVQGENRKISDFGYDGRITTNFTFPTKTRLQLMGFYRGPEIEISEQQEQMYWFSAALRQELLDRKMTVTLRVDDIFATRIRRDTGNFQNSVVYSEGYRESPFLLFP